MKLSRIILGASLIFLLTGCTLILGKKTSSSSSSQQGSSSGSQSSSQSSTELPPDVQTYYSSISDSLMGNDLRTALNTLNNQKKTSEVGYAGFRQFAAKSDIDPTSGSNKIVGFYDNTLVGPGWDNGTTWNREHMWPESLGGGKVEGDAHMVRPTSTSINSERGNMYYGSVTGTYDPGQYFADYRGISARVIFYCAIADTSLNIIDSTSGGSNQMGKLSDLLRWNLQYLPGDSTTELRVEQNRNEVIQKDSSGQGNRNPFIDHPEYACKIWGNTNSETKSICGMR